MTVYSWATDPNLVPPTVQEIRLIGRDGMLQGPFSAYAQTVTRPKHWRMSCTWKNVYGGQRADLLAFFHRLNGKEHRVRMPFFGQVQRGELGGTPVVDGASQTGNSLNISGGTISQTGWIKAGDIFQASNTLHMATADADTDGSGDVTVEFTPEIRATLTNGESVAVSASSTTIWILDSDVSMIQSSMMRRSDGDIIQDSFTLDFVEDIANA